MSKKSNPLQSFIWISERTILLIIAVATIYATGLEIIRLVSTNIVTLSDLFLLFIYVEIIGMVGAYYSTHKIPVTFPIVIAITALCRLLILQGKESEPWVLIGSAGAILVLAGAIYILNIGKGDIK